MESREVFIIGSKGIPARYGGFESFVENLTYYRKENRLQYHVACLSEETEKETEFIYNNAHCFKICVPDIGSAKAVLYDLKALSYVLRYIKFNNIEKPIVYILACRIGFAIKYYKKKIENLGGTFLLNPDGHEWKRAKWNWLIKKYWKYSERMMVKQADMVVCDSETIEKYIKSEYFCYSPKTIYIAYGSNIDHSCLMDNDQKVVEWYQKNLVKPEKYYLVVGRFVPENNYEIIIKEFMKTTTDKDLVFITNIDNTRFMQKIKADTKFEKDSRIKFVGTVYDKELLKKIRESAFGYIHGHEVGGTNPSLLEALGATSLNLLLDVGFNREVGRDAVLYWEKSQNSLAKLIMKIDKIPEKKRKELEKLAKNQILSRYDWNDIVARYEKLFMEISSTNLRGI